MGSFAANALVERKGKYTMALLKYVKRMKEKLIKQLSYQMQYRILHCSVYLFLMDCYRYVKFTQMGRQSGYGVIICGK